MDNPDEFMGADEFISQTIFDHGKKFYDSYNMLNTTKETNLPALVCLAFSIELFFKSLRTRVYYKRVETFTEGMVIHKYHDKSIVTGKHNLLELFKGLHPNMQNDIRARYEKEYFSSIEKDLSNVSSGFIDWRYMYEGKTNVIHLTTVQNIGSFMYFYVRKKIEENC